MAVGNFLTLALAVVQTDSPQTGAEQKFLHEGKLNAVLCSHCLKNPTNAIASDNPILGTPVLI